MATKATSGKRRTPARKAVSRPATKARPGTTPVERPRRVRARPVEPPAEAPVGVEPAELAFSTPEPQFAARVAPPAPEPPRPTLRRAIFLDVENTSRPQHLAGVIDHLAVHRVDCQTELVAVANWKVVSQESARLLARAGAHLVHSAPSTGVRDWSDLRIAVSAGIWLATARPGDAVEIVSDDRAFDAVGDVAASLGVGFRRLSHRGLVEDGVIESAALEPRLEPERDSRGRRRRGGRGGRGRSRMHGPPVGHARPREAAAPGGAPRPARPPSAEPRAVEARGPAGPPAPADAHTAPHDEVVAVVRGLVESSPTRRISIDVLANTLKSRGFRRPPGSPRLLTRLRRIREIVVSPSGAIMLADEAPGEAGRPVDEVRTREPVDAPLDAAPAPLDGSGTEEAESPAGPPPAPQASRGSRRRRRWRGGRRRPAQSPAPA
jgi:hypothetical protein